MKRMFFLALFGCANLMASQTDNASIRAEIEQIKQLLPLKGSPLSDCAVGIQVSGDFLYWISNQDAVWMGTLEGPPAFLSGSNVFSDVRVLNQKFEFDPGFRVAAAYFWEQKAWQTQASWTRYRTTSSTQHGVAPNEWLMSSWGFASQVNLFTILNMQQTWKLHYDVVDVALISQNFNYRKCSFSPTVGMRGAWIKQEITQNLIIEDLPPFFADATGIMQGENKFSGFGVLAATNLQFKIYGGLSICANVLGSLNYGKIKAAQDYVFLINNGEPLTAYSPRETMYRVRANAEIQGGLSWQRTFADGRTALSLMLAYEQIVWANMNFFKRYFAEEGMAGTLQFAIEDLSGNLTLRGLTARAGLEF